MKILLRRKEDCTAGAIEFAEVGKADALDGSSCAFFNPEEITDDDDDDVAVGMWVAEGTNTYGGTCPCLLLAWCFKCPVITLARTACLSLFVGSALTRPPMEGPLQSQQAAMDKCIDSVLL